MFIPTTWRWERLFPGQHKLCKDAIGMDGDAADVVVITVLESLTAAAAAVAASSARADAEYESLPRVGVVVVRVMRRGLLVVHRNEKMWSIRFGKQCQNDWCSHLLKAAN